MGTFDDLDVFFADFSVDCQLPGGSTVKVIKDSPDAEALNGMAFGIKDVCLAKTSDFASVNEKDQVTIGGVHYSVRKVLRIDDGKLCYIYLEELGAA